MRKWRVIIAVTMCLLAAWLIFVLIHEPPRPFVKLPDGTILEIKEVSYGKRGTIHLENQFERVKLWVAQHLPKKWGDRLAKPPTPLTISWDSTPEGHANRDALHIWVTQREVGGKLLELPYNYAQIVDRHGCVFECSSGGGFDDGRGPLITKSVGMSSSSARPIVEWFNFEAFPHEERKFLFRIFGYGKGETNYNVPPKLIAEFGIQNQGRSSRRAPGWTPELLPIAKRSGDAAFVLKKVPVVPHPAPGPVGNNFQLTPVFEGLKEGQVIDEWDVTGMVLSDCTGNVTMESYRGATNVRCLCFEELAWKLTARFVGSEALNPGSNETWNIRGITVPEPGKFTKIEGERVLSGVNVRTLGLSGPGTVRYSNEAVVGTAVMNSTRDMMGIGGQGSTSYSSTRPQVSFIIKGMQKDQRLSVLLTDEQGRQFYGRRFRSGMTQTNVTPTMQFLDYYVSPLPPRLLLGPIRQPPGVVVFDLPPDAKTVDVTFCVHNARDVEFVFKPPPRPAK